VPIPGGEAPHFVILQADLFASLEAFLNGIITNDKFCMSRAGRLQLRWWRLPRSLRLPAPPQTVYPTERHEGEVESQEDRYEGTGVSHPASGHSSNRCPTEVGSSVSESDPMEPWSAPGSLAGCARAGEAQVIRGNVCPRIYATAGASTDH